MENIGRATSSASYSQEFLTSVLDLTSINPSLVSLDPSRPYVTLTFAQSLDAKIAGRGGKQLILSGQESMVMTHWMRTMHDGILIGIGTALNDDPQLNTRHLPAIPGNTYHLPRPIILDSRLRFSTESKLLRNYREGRGRRPWIICSPPSQQSDTLPDSDPAIQAHTEWVQRRQSLEKAGAAVFEVATVNGVLTIAGILVKIRSLGINSLMVEGGASVIGSFLAEAAASVAKGEKSVIDTIIVTVSPTFVGEDGVGYGLGLSGEKIPAMRHLRTEMMGKDCVVAMSSAL